MSITTRAIMKKLWNTDQLTEEEESASQSKTPDEFLTDINYEKFDSTEDELQVINALKESCTPDHLDSVDGREHIKPRLLALAKIHFKSYADAMDDGEPDLVDLYIAYKGGFYEALDFEVKQCLAIITNDKTSEDKRRDELTNLTKHLNRFCQLYWTIGFAYASRAFINVGTFYANDEATSVQSTYYYELAAKYFLYGKQLMNQKQSTDICNILYPDIGFAGTGWGSMDSAESTVFSRIPTERRIGIFEESKTGIREFIGSNRLLRHLLF